MGKVLDASPDTWNELISLNLTSIFYYCKVIGGVMVRQNSSNIINMSTVTGLGPAPNRAIYGATKAGNISLIKRLAIELSLVISVSMQSHRD